MVVGDVPTVRSSKLTVGVHADAAKAGAALAIATTGAAQAAPLTTVRRETRCFWLSSVIHNLPDHWSSRTGSSTLHEVYSAQTNRSAHAVHI